MAARNRGHKLTIEIQAEHAPGEPPRLEVVSPLPEGVPDPERFARDFVRIFQSEIRERFGIPNK